MNPQSNTFYLFIFAQYCGSLNSLFLSPPGPLVNLPHQPAPSLQGKRIFAPAPLLCIILNVLTAKASGALIHTPQPSGTKTVTSTKTACVTYTNTWRLADFSVSQTNPPSLPHCSCSHSHHPQYRGLPYPWFHLPGLLLPIVNFSLKILNRKVQK